MSAIEINVRNWLIRLGALTAGTMPPAEARGKIAAYSSPLCEDFPLEAFCERSLKDVAAQCKFFPAYGELCQHLSAWWRDNRPHANILALGSPQSASVPAAPDAPTSEAMEYVSRVVTAFKAERAALSSASPEAKPVANPLPISDGALLHEYEKLAAQGDACAQTRVALLRRKLGVQAHA